MSSPNPGSSITYRIYDPNTSIVYYQLPYKSPDFPWKCTKLQSSVYRSYYKLYHIANDVKHLKESIEKMISDYGDVENIKFSAKDLHTILFSYLTIYRLIQSYVELGSGLKDIHLSTIRNWLIDLQDLFDVFIKEECMKDQSTSFVINDLERSMDLIDTLLRNNTL